MSSPLATQSDLPIIRLLNSPSIRNGINAAVPAHIGPDRYIRMVLTCIRTTPKLATCDQLSMISAIFELASLGLEPNTPLGHAFLIPYGSKATVVIGYKGFVAMANRAGILIDAEAVYHGDVFDYALGTKAFITHKPCDKPEDRGPIVKAYAVATWADGRQRHKVVTQADIESARSKSASYTRNKKHSAWVTDESAMWIKTAVRRLATLLPMSAEFARAIQLDDAAEKGEQRLVMPDGVMLPDSPESSAGEADRLAADVREVSDKEALDDECYEHKNTEK